MNTYIFEYRQEDKRKEKNRKITKLLELILKKFKFLLNNCKEKSFLEKHSGDIV
jgi:hypothetical protein